MHDFSTRMIFQHGWGSKILIFFFFTRKKKLNGVKDIYLKIICANFWLYGLCLFTNRSILLKPNWTTKLSKFASKIVQHVFFQMMSLSSFNTTSSPWFVKCRYFPPFPAIPASHMVTILQDKFVMRTTVEVLAWNHNHAPSCPAVPVSHTMLPCKQENVAEPSGPVN